jgi:chromosomal replication initiator protein
MNDQMTDDLVQKTWLKVSESLRSEIGDTSYKSWLKPMSVREVRNGKVRIAVPTRFMRDWVIAHYVERLESLWSREIPEVANNLFIYSKTD